MVGEIPRSWLNWFRQLMGGARRSNSGDAPPLATPVVELLGADDVAISSWPGPSPYTLRWEYYPNIDQFGPVQQDHGMRFDLTGTSSGNIASYQEGGVPVSYGLDYKSTQSGYYVFGETPDGVRQPRYWLLQEYPQLNDLYLIWWCPNNQLR